MFDARIMVGDARERLRELPDGSVRTCVTSPPYWGLRDYGNDEQIGLESGLNEYVASLVLVFDEVRRVLADDGTLWLNLGDSYLKDKQLAGVPWRVAFALQDNGWILRQDIIWAKPNPMPESVTDRCTKSHEYIFLMSKSLRYYYDHEAIKTDVKADWGTRDRSNWKYGKEGSGLQPHGGMTKNYTKANKRSVWQVTTSRYKDAHFATYPPALIEPCILAGSAEGDTVLDPFSGSGTTGEVALNLGRNYVGVELNPDYAKLSEKRITEAVGIMGKVELC